MECNALIPDREPRERTHFHSEDFSEPFRRIVRCPHKLKSLGLSLPFRTLYRWNRVAPSGPSGLLRREHPLLVLPFVVSPESVTIPYPNSRCQPHPNTIVIAVGF